MDAGGWLVDTDPTLGSAWSDVDDVLAVAHLVGAGARVAGLTTCFGNAPLARVTATARALGDRFGVPVHAGARGPGDVHTAAVEALRAHRGGVLALAPLTNVAAALDAGARWERLVVLGGTTARRPNVRGIVTTELNFALDEGAAARVLEAVDVLVPMEPCRTVRFDARALAAAPGWLRDGCAPWLATSVLRTGSRAFHPWDLLAAAVITHPALFTYVPARVRLRAGWLRRGRITVAPADEPAGVCRIALRVDGAGLHAAWAASVARLADPP